MATGQNAHSLAGAFHMRFTERESIYLGTNSTDVCSRGLSWMTVCQLGVGDQPLVESVVTQFYNMHVNVPSGLNELTYCLLLYALVQLVTMVTHGFSLCLVSGLILALHPANEKRRHFVKTSLIGRVQA